MFVFFGLWKEARVPWQNPPRIGPEGRTHDLPAAERQREPLHHRVANFIHQNLKFKRVTRLQTAPATQSVCDMKVGKPNSLTVQIHIQESRGVCSCEVQSCKHWRKNVTSNSNP